MLSRHRRALISLFQRIHDLEADRYGKRLLALEIQEELLVRITRAESAVRRWREANTAVKRQLASPGKSRDEARKLKEQHAAGEERIRQQKELLSVLRSIGDAVAFIYGDRWELKQLVWHPEPGFITGKRGTRLERGILRAAFAHGAIAVMNDLTHTLRHGDITIFNEDGTFALMEAKSGRGGNHSRSARQLAAIDKIGAYLTTDVREVEGGTWRRVEAAEHPVHHFEAMTRLARNLPPGGWLVEEVEPGLHYAIIDTAGGNERVEPMLQQALGGRTAIFALPVNEMKQARLAYYPFPLCLRDTEVLFRFYNGDFVAFVFVELNRVNEALARHGLSVQASGDDEFPWQILDGTQGEHGVHYLGYHPLGRLAAEFLRLDWLLNNIVVNGAGETMRREFERGAAAQQASRTEAP